MLRMTLVSVVVSILMGCSLGFNTQNYVPPDRTVNFDDVIVIINKGMPNESKGIIVGYLGEIIHNSIQADPTKSQQILIAPSKVFNDNKDYFTISFVNLNPDSPPSIQLPKKRQLYGATCEIMNNEKYKISSISMKVAHPPEKYIPSEFGSKNTLLHWELEKKKSIREELLNILEIEYENKDEAVESICDFVLETVNSSSAH